jgi:hypothetical protein
MGVSVLNWRSTQALDCGGLDENRRVTVQPLCLTGEAIRQCAGTAVGAMCEFGALSGEEGAG